MEAVFACDLDAPNGAEIPLDWDDPIWYKPDGSLWRLENLWYLCPRILECVLAAVPEKEVERVLEVRNKNNSLGERWREIRRGTADSYKSADVVDRIFTRLGLPPFHTVLGPPEKAWVPGGKAPRMTLQEAFQIRRRRREGEKVKDLAAAFKFGEQTILRVCRKTDEQVYQMYAVNS